MLQSEHTWPMVDVIRTRDVTLKMMDLTMAVWKDEEYLSWASLLLMCTLYWLSMTLPLDLTAFRQEHSAYH
jgi:hypothetical protein